MTHELQFGECVATFCNRVGADEKDYDIGIVDSAFDLLIKAFAGRELVAIHKDGVTAVSERKCYGLSCSPVFRRIR